MEMLNQLVDAAVQQGKTVILITHDLEQGIRAATRAAIVDKGKVVFSSSGRDSALRDAYSSYIRIGVSP